MTTVLESSASAACAVKPANLPRPRPVSVNGVTIPRAAISREVQNHPADKPVEAWLAAARALVIRELLLQEARRLGIAPEPLALDDGRRETDDEAIIRVLVEREIVQTEADEETCRRYFDKNQGKFHSPPLFAVRHILCAAAPADEAGRQQARQLAERLIAELEVDITLFSGLASTHSSCPSREVGGSLGQISRGQTVPEFERQLERMVPGMLAPVPVETRYGYHVVLLEQRIDGRPLPFEAVKKPIADWLNECAQLTAIRRYIALLAERAEISGIDFDAQGAPLVQQDGARTWTSAS